MTYRKPSNIKYTEMCIYVDQNIYQPNCDYEKCFEYIYHIYYMLAFKKRLFKNSKDYDEFALYAAATLLVRYKSPKKSNDPIKSILNYAKSSVYGLSINFQRKWYKELLNEYSVEETALQNLREVLIERVVDSNKWLAKVEVDTYFKYASRTIKQIIQESPYINDSTICHNLYLSILLTFIASVSLNKNNRKRLLNTKVDIEVIYAQEADDIILFHLPQEFYNYVQVLTRRAKHMVSKDIAYIVGCYRPSDAIIQEILKSPLRGGSEEDEN